MYYLLFLISYGKRHDQVRKVFEERQITSDDSDVLASVHLPVVLKGFSEES